MVNISGNFTFRSETEFTNENYAKVIGLTWH